MENTLNKQVAHDNVATPIELKNKVAQHIANITQLQEKLSEEERLLLELLAADPAQGIELLSCDS